MNKFLKVALHILGIILSVGVLWAIVFETSGWGINFLNTHNKGERWYLYLIAVVLGLISGIIMGGLKDFLNNHWSETVQSETRYNPAWGWAAFAILVNVALALLLE